MSKGNPLENRYQKLEKLGEGTYGVVYKGYDIQNKIFVALKKFRLELDEDEGVSPTTLREISILKKLNHANIVSLLDVCMNAGTKKLYLVFEYLDFDLKTYIDSLPKEVPRRVYLSIFNQILQGIAFAHDQGVYHRDLKPQNILVSKEGIIKIADFGLSRSNNKKVKSLTKEIVTLWYRAPEILLGEKKYDESVDVWAIGCIFAEVIKRKPLFRGDSQIDQLFKIFKCFGTPSEKNWPGYTKFQYYKTSFPLFRSNIFGAGNAFESWNHFDKDIFEMILSCLRLDPLARTTCKQALNSSIFEF
jgi:cyclin-dependent kinase 1